MDSSDLTERENNFKENNDNEKKEENFDSEKKTDIDRSEQVVQCRVCLLNFYISDTVEAPFGHVCKVCAEVIGVFKPSFVKVGKGPYLYFMTYSMQ